MIEQIKLLPREEQQRVASSMHKLEKQNLSDQPVAKVSEEFKQFEMILSMFPKPSPTSTPKELIDFIRMSWDGMGAIAPVIPGTTIDDVIIPVKLGSGEEYKIRFRPPFSRMMSMVRAPASIEFSTSSLTPDAGRSTTSPAAI